MAYEIIELESIDSTNRVATDLANRGKDAYTVVVAEYQSAGRGRLGKNWLSVKGKGLYFSVILRPVIALEKLASITLVIGLCVAETIESLYGLKVALKWPNDLYVNGKKLGGILVEANRLNPSGQSCLIAGIGINISMNENDLRAISEQAATSIAIETEKNIEKRMLLNRMLNQLENAIAIFEESGFEPFMAQWQSRDYLIDKKIKVVSTAREIVEGRVIGIDSTGQMRLEDDFGIIHNILSGDVRLAQ